MPGSNARPLPASDLEHVLTHTEGLWGDLRDGRLFVTGGTGFFGRWMLESFLRANDELALGAEAIVLTRDPHRFAVAAPHVAEHHAITLNEGDIRTFDDPGQPCTHILHMATETALDSPTASFRTAVLGTERVLALAKAHASRKLLLTSSGAVYGSDPSQPERISEEYGGAPRPEDEASGYGHGKRAAEFLCCAASANGGPDAKIARCFAFVGPLLPLDANFAIGNFIRDALRGEAIDVAGDGTARRSYLYAADLAIWLWTILIRGTAARPYNVGSEEDLSIADLASLVARVVRPGSPVRIRQSPSSVGAPRRYVPSTMRAQDELGLRGFIGLDDAVLRTAEWYRAGPIRSGRG